jgi:arylsulfatase A
MKVILTLIFALATIAAMATDKPNIILIMADDLGYECLGVNGAADYKSPNLDQMAADGMRFEHCYSQPICTPTRVKLMTGIYNKRNYERFGYLPTSQTTFANILQKEGYKTCVVGKWQLEGGLEGPKKFGFDEYCLWQLTRRPSRFPNPGLEINGKAVDFKNGEYGPTVVNDYALDFIKRNKDTPFLLYYPMILTHCPFEPTPDSKDWDPKSPGSKTYKGNDKYFGDMVTYMDKMVGRILKQLDDLKIADNTLVMFIGDNGTDKPVVTKMKDGTTIAGNKGSMKNAGNHVPFIVRWPGKINAGITSQEMVDFSDFLPTICDTASAAIPKELPINGHSMLPMFKGGKGPRQWAYVWYARNGGAKGSEFARNQRYKLYGNGKFYDMEKDPLEKKSLKTSELSEKNIGIHKMLSAAIEQYDGIRSEKVAQATKKKKPRKR